MISALYLDRHTEKNHSNLKFFYPQKPFQLESGNNLAEVKIAYQTFGALNSKKNNVVWVCHALTANADPTQWWNGLIGSDSLINPSEHYIVCANILGSCYGTTGPRDFNPNTDQRYLSNFPNITIRDQVNAHELLREYLGIEAISLVIGGSTGGQQVLEWTTQKDIFNKAFVIATSANSSPWGKAIRAAQRMAIEADPTFYSNSVNGGKKGMEAARAMALLSYRTPYAFNQSQKDDDHTLENFRAESYQRYQGIKLSRRFDARSYYILGKAMDSHNLARSRGSSRLALQEIKAKTLVIGIESDILFTINEQKFIANHIPSAQFHSIQSEFGHDGFLIETEKITQILRPFLKNESN
jgi:homoserine O-acetyltransferase